MWFSFDIHVVTSDVSILLEIDDMDKMSVYLNNLGDELVHEENRLVARIVRENGPPFIQ